MKGGDDDDDVWNASAVILDIDSGVYTGRLCKLLLWYCMYAVKLWDTTSHLYLKKKKSYLFILWYGIKLIGK